MVGEWCVEVPTSKTPVRPAAAGGSGAFSPGSTVGPADVPGVLPNGAYYGSQFMPGLDPGPGYYTVQQSKARRAAGNPLARYSTADFPAALRPDLYGNLPFLPLNPVASTAIEKKTNLLLAGIGQCAFLRNKYKISPLQAMPRDGKEFRQLGSAALSAFQTAGAYNGLDVTILSFTVPTGFDGVLTNVITQFTGTGHVEGSGDIVWRVLQNNHFVRNMGAIFFQFGSLQNTSYIVPGSGIPLISGQLISLIGSIPAGSAVGGAGAVVIMGAVGWLYPRK